MAKLIEFSPPAGLKLPEALEADGEFDALATFRYKKSGKICLVEIDGNPMPGYKDNDADEGDYVAGVGKRYEESMMPNNPGMPVGGMKMM